MNFLQFCRWLEKTPIADLMNGPEWMFPAVESIHIIGLTLLVGTVTIVCLSFLGMGLRRPPVWELAQRLAPWTRLGLWVMLITGPLMFSADAVHYYSNVAFHFKMLMLALALIAHFTLYRKAVASRKPHAWGKWASCVTLLLWLAVMLGGRAIAFF